MSTSTYVKRICKNCGKTFLHNNKYYLKKFCCLQCCTEYNKGKDRRIYTVDDNFLKKESFEKYYILGLYAADGCIYNKYEKGIHLSQSGEAGLLLVSYVKKLLRCSAPITKVLDKSYKTKYILHFNSKVEIAYGAGEKIVVCKKDGGSEDQLDANACLFEHVCGRERVAVCRDLLHSGDAVVNLADHAVIFAVNGDDTRDGVGTACPMHSIFVCESVSLRPHTEEWVNGDQRISGSSEFHSFSPFEL